MIIHSLKKIKVLYWDQWHNDEPYGAFPLHKRLFIVEKVSLDYKNETVHINYSFIFISLYMND